MNWASFVLGIVIVGLETGWFYAYKAGFRIKCYGEIRNNMSVIKKRRRTITVENVKYVWYVDQDDESPYNFQVIRG